MSSDNLKSLESLKSRIWELLDGSLSPEESLKVRQEIEARPDGEELFQSMRSLTEALPVWNTPEPSSHFVANVMAKVEPAQASERSTDRTPVAPESLGFVEFIRELIFRRIAIPVPIGTAALALLFFSALLNMKLLSSSDEGAGTGPGTSPMDVTPVNLNSPETGNPGESGSPEKPIMILDDPRSEKKKEEEEREDGKARELDGQ